MLKDKIPTTVVKQETTQEQHKKLRSELRRLTAQIENLEMSEDERLARELQAIELNIQEKERQIYLVSTH